MEKVNFTPVLPNGVKKYYALCVDDEQSALNQLSGELEDHFRSFCEFEYAKSAEEALSLYQELICEGNQVWLIISDQFMPGMAGDVFLAKIHELDPYSMKMLLIDPIESESMGRAIKHAGLNYYLEKPWQKEDLLLILDKLKFQYEMSTILHEANLRFASSIDLEETLNAVFYNILTVIQAEAGSIFLIDPLTNTLVCRVCQGPKDIKGVRVPLGSGIVGYVAKTGQADVTTDVKHDSRHNPLIDEQSGFITKSMISVPLISKDKIIGVIQTINKKGGRLFSQDDVKLLQSLSNGGALAIQNAQYAQRLLQEERIRSELLIAHQIQQGILPGSFEGHPDIDFEAINEPAREIGGDFYDYFQVNEDEFVFMIGDVCGKGVPAAIFMASARSIIKSQAFADSHPASVMPLANQLITKDAQPGMFVTVFYGVYNVRTHLLRFTNAGHTLALLFRPSLASCSVLLNGNIPVGLMSPTNFEDAEIQLEKGDKLVLYTDGINEAVNAEGKQFGVERLVNIILEHGTHSCKELRETIIHSVNTFSEGQEQNDDITLLIAQV